MGSGQSLIGGIEMNYLGLHGVGDGVKFHLPNFWNNTMALGVHSNLHKSVYDTAEVACI